MNWASPTFAAIVAAIAIPTLVILYFLKLRRKTVEISSTLLWKKAIQDLQANAPFQKLRRNILLLLQLLVLAAALLALAQPQQAAEREIGAKQVILIDRSASMASADGGEDGKTRLELAKERAIEVVRSMREPDLLGSGQADEAMVIAFDASAEILVRFTSDRDQLEGAINAIEQTDAPSSISEAFKLAQAQRPRRTFIDNAGGRTEGQEVAVEGLVGGPGLRFHLFSDGRIEDLREIILNEERDQAGQAVSSTDSFEYHAAGAASARNVSIVGLRADRDYEDPTRLSIFVSLQSTDEVARSVDVELELPGRGTVAIKTVRLPGVEPSQPGETSEDEGIATLADAGTSGVSFDLIEPRGLVAEVRVRPGDGVGSDVLETDNRGWLVVPPAERSSVAVVTRGNLFIPEALGGLPLARLDTMTPEQFEARRTRGEMNGYDVVVLDQYLPTTAGDTRALPPGRWLVIGATPDGVGLVDEGAGGATAVLTADRLHPVLRDVVLDGLRIAVGRRVRLENGAPAAVLMETPLGAGIIEVATNEARAIVIPWDVARSNWPWDVGFVVFLAAAVDYLGRDAVSAELGGTPRQIAPGDVLTATLPVDARDVLVVPPSGEREDVEPAPDGSVVYGPIRRSGVYSVRWRGASLPTDASEGDRAARFFAANLLSPAESDVRALQSIDLGSRTVGASEQEALSLREYWPWLIGAALAIMMLEWWIYNRKVYV